MLFVLFSVMFLGLLSVVVRVGFLLLVKLGWLVFVMRWIWLVCRLSWKIWFFFCVVS